MTAIAARINGEDRTFEIQCEDFAYFEAGAGSAYNLYRRIVGGNWTAADLHKSRVSGCPSNLVRLACRWARERLVGNGGSAKVFLEAKIERGGTHLRPARESRGQPDVFR